MSIGETLAQARRRAGLTLSEVSQRTRIRETLIRDIERDDYSATGGDFYTRGHIRAIARVVGTDPGPLIEEYDVARRPPSPDDPAAWHELLVERGPGGSVPDGPGPGGSGPGVGPGAPGGEPAGGYAGDPESTLDHGPLWRELPPRDGAAWDEPPPERGARWSDPRPGRAAPADEDPADRTARWERTAQWDGPTAGSTAPWDEPPAGRAAPWDERPFRTEPAPGPAGPVISLGGEEDAPRTRGGVAFRGGGPLPPRTRRRRRNTPLLVGAALVVVLGLLGYFFIANTGGSPAGGPAAGGPTAGSGRTAAGGRAAGSAHPVVVRLSAVKDTTVVFTTPHGGYLFRSNVAAGTSKQWTFNHPVRMRLADPGAVRLAVDGKNPLPSGSAQPVTLSLSPGHPATVTATPGHPTPRASTPAPTAAQQLTPASAAAFGPSGGQGDNPAEAQLAIDGKPGTAWNTDWYTSANFGNLYPGTGLLLDMGRPVTVTAAQITLGGPAGADLQLRAGPAPTLAALSPVARATGASGTVPLRPTTPAHGRYLLIWFTKLPLTSAGNYEASVYDVKVQGHT